MGEPEPCCICSDELTNSTLVHNPQFENNLHQFCLDCILSFTELNCPLCRESCSSAISSVTSINYNCNHYIQVLMNENDPMPVLSNHHFPDQRSRNVIIHHVQLRRIRERVWVIIPLDPPPGSYEYMYTLKLNSYLSCSIFRNLFAITPKCPILVGTVFNIHTKCYKINSRDDNFIVRYLYHYAERIESLRYYTPQHLIQLQYFPNLSLLCPELSNILGIQLFNEESAFSVILRNLNNLIETGKTLIRIRNFRDEVRSILHYYIGTEHFIHEFYHFAFSSFDIVFYVTSFYGPVYIKFFNRLKVLLVLRSPIDLIF